MRYFICLLIVFLSIIVPCLSYADTNTTQRAAFIAALSNLQQGKQQQFLVIADHLRSYPLYPYLLYADLAIHLSEATPEQLEGFLRAYSDTPLADHLRQLWLLQLALHHQWAQYLAVYKPIKNLKLQCLQRQAWWETGQSQNATEGLSDLISKNQNPPQACLIVFQEALQQGDIARQLLWRRITTAMQANNLALASQFANFLSLSEQRIFVLWQAVYAHPQLLLHTNLFKFTGTLTEPILLTGIERMAERNPRLAIIIWQRLRASTHFSVALQEKVIKEIAIALSTARDPLALSWLMAIDPVYVDKTVQESRIRTALYQQNWAIVEQTLKMLPLDQQKTAQWRYWLARSFAMQNEKAQAISIYKDLALRSDFYGQLSALQLKQSPSFFTQPLKVSHAQVLTLNHVSAMQRAHELYLLGWLPEAQQEWIWAIQHLPEEEDLAAAELAFSWGWFERAIATINLMDDAGRLALRFPLGYRPQVVSAAVHQHLNPAWLFAVIRQESRFTPYAKSSVGAVGLMQLMPNTATQLAAKLHLPFSVSDLGDTEINLELGSFYLKEILPLFNANIVLATAAYDAGPGRVEKWMPPILLPADIWIETIPYHETRDYVKNIMASMTFYEKELGLSSTLESRMQPI